MKKLLGIGLVAVMVASSLVGCGKGESSTTKLSKNNPYAKYLTLCNYKGIEAKKITFDVTDEDIQEQIDMDMYEYADYTDVTDRACEDGDYVQITYTGYIDDKESENYCGEEEEYQLGEGYFFEEAEKQIVGMSIGDEKTIEFKLTEDDAFDEEDAGKKVRLEVKVDSIYVEDIPEYNEKFVKDKTEFDSMKEYEESVKKELTESKEQEYKEYTVGQIMEYLTEHSEFDGYPDDLYEECKAEVEANNEYYAGMYGMSLEDFMETFGIDEESQKEEIESNVNTKMIIKAIAYEEKIEVSDDEANKYVEDNYSEFGYQSAEEFLEFYSLDDVKFALVYDKVGEYLYDHAKLTDMTEEDYLAEQEAEYQDYEDEDAEEVEDGEELEIEEVEGEEELEETDVEEAETDEEQEESTKEESSDDNSTQETEESEK